MSEWTDRAQLYMTGKVNSLFKKHPEQVAKLEAADKNYQWKGDSFVITASASRDRNGQYAIRFQLGNRYTSLIVFTLDCYPACCALHQLNDFSVADSLLLEPFLEDFISLCIRAYQVSVNNPRRIMINFVEYSRQDVYKPNVKEIPRVANESITFPMMYKWAKEKDHIETLFVNHNTGRIIHNVIVNLE